MNPSKIETETRRALTRERVLETALSLVDREGAEALTMRRLGRELGVAAMSLYNHVANREDLLDGLSEVMVQQIRVEPGASAPRQALWQFMDGIRTVARAHPQAFGLVGMRPLHTEAALRPVESTLAALRQLGVEGENAVHAYRAMAAYARGFALAEIAGFTLEQSAAGTAGISAGELDRAEFRNVVELAQPLATPDRDAAFRFGAEALLEGLLTSS